MKELGNINYFLGISADHTPTGYFRSQPKYALEILEKAGMVNCKPYCSPVALKPNSDPADMAPFAHPHINQTRPGICC